MMIERLSKLKNYRIFKDFSWPNTLPNFSKKNLIYGWNGTGKSTLSALFRAIECSSDLSEGEIELRIAGQIVKGNSLSTATSLPQVKVFNKEFVENNIFNSSGDVAPIFFFGEQSIEKQTRLTQLQDELLESKNTQRLTVEKQRGVEKDFEKFLKEQARLIKDRLRSSVVGNKYNNYTKTSFSQKCEELLSLSVDEQKKEILDEENFQIQLKRKDEHPLPKLASFSLKFPDTPTLTKRVIPLLERKVVSETIENLVQDEKLAKWVKEGLDRYQHDRNHSCHFCGSRLSPQRISALEGHFNDQYNALIEELKEIKEQISLEIDKLDNCVPVDSIYLYSHLRTEYEEAKVSLGEEVSRVKSYLRALISSVDAKVTSPFQSVELTVSMVIGDSVVIQSLNKTIGAHNLETDTFNHSILQACQLIESSCVANNLDDYRIFNAERNRLSAEIAFIGDKQKELDLEIATIEQEIIETRRPADELNADIKSYLGRAELTFSIAGNGYQIKRGDVPAQNLSEGEKTAISFLYFLKSLEDKSFDLSKGIVVIDDPISSLDSNALYYAFGFMKTRTANAAQLFILTHNHMFFRQVKNWFSHLPGQNKRDITLRPAQFYMLLNTTVSNERSSELRELDRLLREYDSEYLYLFKIVYKITTAGSQNLEEKYHLPNVARRLLEAFLAFRKPTQAGELKKQLDSIQFDDAKKNRILRFCHTYSHQGNITDPGHDLSLLVESDEIMEDIMALILQEDRKHHDEMVLAVS